jgi:hypothetical protein
MWSPHKRLQSRLTQDKPPGKPKMPIRLKQGTGFFLRNPFLQQKAVKRARLEATVSFANLSFSNGMNTWIEILCNSWLLLNVCLFQ